MLLDDQKGSHGECSERMTSTKSNAVQGESWTPKSERHDSNQLRLTRLTETEDVEAYVTTFQQNNDGSLPGFLGSQTDPSTNWKGLRCS